MISQCERFRSGYGARRFPVPGDGNAARPWCVQARSSTIDSSYAVRSRWDPVSRCPGRVPRATIREALGRDSSPCRRSSVDRFECVERDHGNVISTKPSFHSEPMAASSLGWVVHGDWDHGHVIPSRWRCLDEAKFLLRANDPFNSWLDR